MCVRFPVASLIAITLLSACGDAGGPPSGEDAGDIAFVQDGDIYSIALADGATPRHVAAALIAPSWSPDGTQLAALRTGDQPAIFLLRPDGRDVHQLTRMDWSPYTLSGATWRPDGQVLTYSVRAIFSTQHLPDIWSINVDGTDEKLNEVGGYDDLTWSPDGNRYTLRLIPNLILVVRRSDNARSRLAFGCCVDWSPDGRTIAYAGDGAIHLIAPDSTNHRALPGPSGGNSDYLPKWSPDGGKIAFLTFNSLEGTFPRQVAGVMNADGTGRIALAPGIQTNSSVDWSPDGTHLAFTAFESADDVAASKSHLYIVSPDGSDLHAIAGPAPICCFVWRP